MGEALWIGGLSGAGKTTLARRLVRRHGLRLYSADTMTWDHVARVGWQDKVMTVGFHRVRGPLAWDDVARLPAAPLVVAEGTTLPAALVPPERAVWLLKSSGVKPPASVADVIRAEVEEHGVPALVVDGMSVDDVVAALEDRFADLLANGPHAAGLEERRALLREANEAVVAQIRAGAAEPDGQLRLFMCECGDRACVVELEVTVGAAARRPVLAVGHGS